MWTTREVTVMYYNYTTEGVISLLNCSTMDDKFNDKHCIQITIEKRQWVSLYRILYNLIILLLSLFLACIGDFICFTFYIG